MQFGNEWWRALTQIIRQHELRSSNENDVRSTIHTGTNHGLLRRAFFQFGATISNARTTVTNVRTGY